MSGYSTKYTIVVELNTQMRNPGKYVVYFVNGVHVYPHALIDLFITANYVINWLRLTFSSCCKCFFYYVFHNLFFLESNLELRIQSSLQCFKCPFHAVILQ